jgi:hypothetical protein
MFYTKSLRMFEDDVIQGGLFGSLGWSLDVCNLKNVLSSLGCHSILIKVLPSALFSCALTANAIGLLFCNSVSSGFYL